MHKTNIKFFLLLMILSMNFSLNSLDILSGFFDPENIRNAAEYRVNLREELARQAKIDAEAAAELKKRQELGVAIVKGLACVTFNSARFGWKLFTDTNRTWNRLKAGQENVVLGCFGLTTGTLLGLI